MILLFGSIIDLGLTEPSWLMGRLLLLSGVSTYRFPGAPASAHVEHTTTDQAAAGHDGQWDATARSAEWEAHL